VSALIAAVDLAAANAAKWRERRVRVAREGSALHETVTVWAPMPGDTDQYRANHGNVVDYRLQCLEDAIKGYGVSR